ncbi:MAG: sigma-70 family RNA polymerase sigma factor [Prevotellaceae bacterium]|jgi:RNA polymerase sigma-70 factor (ECF subfamily)|nr:sigma-70 family RNA polymerase sigma factor [Prevotellaceae bacterium]
MPIENSDSELIAACKRDEMWAKKALYERFAPAMLSVCTRYCGSRDVARDALQDAFIKVFTKIAEFRGDGNFEGWLRRIFVTTALERFRYRREIPLDDELSETIENKDFSVFEKLSADDLHKIISELPDPCRTVFNLYAVEDYSHREIAEMLNIKEVTSRSYFFRAREILQKRIREND